MIFSDQICPKIDFWGWNFKNLSPDPESAPPTYHVCQFPDKMDNFEFFGLNLEELPNCMRYFGSNSLEGVVENWVDDEMSRVELGGGGWS